MLCEMSSLQSMRGSRHLFLGPRGNPLFGPDQWRAVGEVGQLMQVGGSIINQMLQFGAIGNNLLGIPNR